MSCAKSQEDRHLSRFCDAANQQSIAFGGWDVLINPGRAEVNGLKRKQFVLEIALCDALPRYMAAHERIFHKNNGAPKRHV
tara:strand:+ start:306 stop:548 length:243 start_codon:yes stop_codon:yes gene_type:complete